MNFIFRLQLQCKLQLSSALEESCFLSVTLYIMDNQRFIFLKMGDSNSVDSRQYLLLLLFFISSIYYPPLICIVNLDVA